MEKRKYVTTRNTPFELRDTGVDKKGIAKVGLPCI
jgi:hypothetical protein